MYLSLNNSKQTNGYWVSPDITLHNARLKYARPDAAIGVAEL